MSDSELTPPTKRATDAGGLSTDSTGPQGPSLPSPLPRRPRPLPEGPFPQDFGRYVLRRMLGGGGMGIVYLADDKRLDLEVALKVPHEDALGELGLIQRFYREARAAARLRHPNLCHVLDIGELGGVHYMTMQYVEGVSLAECPPQEVRDVVRLVRTLAEAMAEAHRLGVIHRDLKMSNVLITPQGEPVIVDFGLALRFDRPDEELTTPGVLVGTLPYMAPEMLRADRPPLGPACDVYALGVLLYRLLVGRLPFSAADVRRLRQRILDEAPVPPSEVRPGLEWLDAVCLKALNKRVEERFATMRDFANALAPHLDATPVVPVPRLPLVRREAIRFVFVGHGERAPLSSVFRDRIYLDVGNDLRPGVIDHHQRTAGCGPTAGLVLAHPNLLSGALLPERAADQSVTLVLHEQPDLDAVASAYLAIAHLTEGAFPDGAEALTRYVARVDEGSLGVALNHNPFSLYVAYQYLANRLLRRPWNSNHEQWQERVRGGLLLLAHVVEQVARGKALPAVDAFACPELFGPEDRQEVLADAERYRCKLADPRCRARRALLELPGQYGGTVAAEALVVRDVQNVDDPERCAFFKDWARTDAVHCPNGSGFVALCVFVSESLRQTRRCILSVVPDSGASLRGLATLLDQAEAERRREIFGVDDRVTGPATGAAKEPRPGYANADPWYDGRGHTYTIVDAPRAGTLLTADEIETIFLRFGRSKGAPVPCT